MKPLRIAVIGVGQMGQNHLKTYAKREDVEVVGFVDTHPDRAKNIAEEYNCRSLTLDEIPGQVDAVSVVTPSETHFDVASFLLQNGVDCLVEKPLAMNEQESLSLVTLAKKHKRTLVVGHVEEYNSGFQYLQKALAQDPQKPKFISCERFNYGSQRIQDADVVLDLMIHDLGCVIDLLGERVKNLKILSAHGFGRSSKSVDVAAVTMQCDDCFITLEASRISHHRHREFSLHTESTSYFLNFISQQVSIYNETQLTEQTTHPWTSPLECEIDHFLECVRDHSKMPLTSGDKAAVAVKFVEEIQRQIYSASFIKAA